MQLISTKVLDRKSGMLLLQQWGAYGPRLSCILPLMAAAAPALRGQVFQVNGGASSLHQAQGGTLAVRGPAYSASLGAGTVAGRFVGGANVTKMVGPSTWIAGDDLIHFVLPTDIFDASHYVVAQGVGVMTRLRRTGVFAFAGATSTEFEQLAPGLALSSKMIFSRQTTAIQGLDWYPADRLKVGFSAGIGANQPYAAASVDFRRKWIIVQAAYIEAGTQFHRAVLEAPLLSEPDRENLVVTWKPARFFSIAGGRQNFLTPLNTSQTNVRSSIDQGTASLTVPESGCWRRFITRPISVTGMTQPHTQQGETSPAACMPRPATLKAGPTTRQNRERSSPTSLRYSLHVGTSPRRDVLPRSRVP